MLLQGAGIRNQKGIITGIGKNRRRFSPSVVIAGIPLSSVERDLFEDYTRYCGPAENIKVVSVSAGLGDNSTRHRNVLKISDLKIYGQS